jgi:hypothetical protein
LPRTSQAGPAVTRASPIDWLAPPAELGTAEAVVFWQTLVATPANYFQPEDLPLQCSHPRAVVLERRAAEELAAATAAGNVPTPWLGVYASVSKTLMNLTVGLSIGLLSRAPSITGDRPSQA